MRSIKIAGLALVCVLAGCGGSSNAPLLPPTAQDRIANAAVLALQIRASEGTINLEPPAGAAPKQSHAWSAVKRDPWRGLFSRTQSTYQQVEPDDGVSPHTIITNEYEFFTDSAMRNPAGTVKSVVDTNEFTRREITTYSETITAGPLAGFRSTRRGDMDLGSSQTEFTATVNHPRFGSMTSSGTLIASANNYTVSITKEGKTDRYSYSETPSTMIVTLADGEKITIVDTEGTITDSKGNNLGTLIQNAGEVSFTFPGRNIIRRIWSSY